MPALITHGEIIMDWIAIVILWASLSGTIDNQNQDRYWIIDRESQQMIKDAEQDAQIKKQAEQLEELLKANPAKPPEGDNL